MSLHNSFPYRLFFAGFVCASFLILGCASAMVDWKVDGEPKDGLLLGLLLIVGSAAMAWVGWFITTTEYRFKKE